MKWYEIIWLVVGWISGLYIIGKLYDYLRNRHYNDSWKDKLKK